jgi:hypothetical protein
MFGLDYALSCFKLRARLVFTLIRDDPFFEVQVKAFPRLEKSALLESALPTLVQKKIFSYRDIPGLSNNRISGYAVYST